MHQFISGTFDDPAMANKAVDDITSLAYPRERITIIMSTQTLSDFGASSRRTPSRRRMRRVRPSAS